MSVIEVPERNSIPEKFKWNLSAIYDSFESWQKSFQEITGKIESLSKYSGKLGDDSKILMYFLYFLRKDFTK